MGENYRISRPFLDTSKVRKWNGQKIGLNKQGYSYFTSDMKVKIQHYNEHKLQIERMVYNTKEIYHWWHGIK